MFFPKIGDRVLVAIEYDKRQFVHADFLTGSRGNCYEKNSGISTFFSGRSDIPL